MPVSPNVKNNPMSCISQMKTVACQIKNQRLTITGIARIIVRKLLVGRRRAAGRRRWRWWPYWRITRLATALVKVLMKAGDIAFSAINIKNERMAI
jgi:hypothetical protein